MFFFAVLVFCLLGLDPLNCGAQEAAFNFPEIRRLDFTDTGFRQFISDVESNRMRTVRNRNSPETVAGFLTIYRYTPRQGEDLFALAARCNLPYSTLASLNRLSGPQSVEPGRPLLLPTCPGIFLPDNPESALELLLAASRDTGSSVELNLNPAGTAQSFRFFPGADFTSTERVFFLNPGFRFPLRAYRLTSAFGTRTDPFSGDLSMHYGIDLAAPAGTEVFSISDGIVSEIGYNYIYGNFILINHRDRLSSFYAHLSSVETSLNARVNSGTLIGRVGSTGLSTGPHLHFELRQDGRPLDPAGRLRPSL